MVDEDRARALWQEQRPDGTYAHTAAQIAAMLGVRKNVLIGVAHRRQFGKRLSPIKIATADSPRKPAPPPRAKRQPASPAPEVRLPPGQGCQWPTSKARPWTFCDAPREDGKPYCPKHCRRAYVKNSD